MSNFNDITDMNLQAWNRLMFSNNLAATQGEEPLREYISQFEEIDRKAMMLVASRVFEYGYEESRKIILANITYEEDSQPDTFMEDLEEIISEEISLEEAEKEGYVNG